MNRRAVLEEKLRRAMRSRALISRESFWVFCKTMASDFYKDERWYLKLYAMTLEALYEKRLTKTYFHEIAESIAPDWFMDEFEWDNIPDREEPFVKLLINIPPRHGKSRTLILFCQWILGKSQDNKIITASYNEDLATDFSRYTRDGISEEKTSLTGFVYSDIFPMVKIKRGDSSYRQWSLEGKHFSYKGAGLGGSVTGKGGNVLIVDDPVKNAEEAYNERMLDKQWLWYTGTFLSRLEESGDRPIEIVNMTRWSKKDLCGRILDGKGKREWFTLKIEVKSKTTGEMLCEDLLTRHRYDYFKDEMEEGVFWANYHQKTIDQRGRLYKSFKVYTELPKDEHGKLLFERIFSYTDTADQGDDYLCTLVVGEYQGYAYVLDVMYTKAGMEETEPETARQLEENNVNLAIFESNNGGEGYARNVRREIKELNSNSGVIIRSFHQSKNKRARIISNSSFLMKRMMFPIDWKSRWPEYYQAMNEYQREGNNAHDDAPDASTGIVEVLQNRIDKLNDNQSGRPTRQRPKGRRR
ncbi:phage terminase large subunit [Ornithinibacillus sp. 4-3]|uniref:Phage terminase large subunit n=1 Tax=Ornithinibacillus sp. 4-3 TaxID=3231488 RepID=A0AB39HLM1_9BACI